MAICKTSPGIESLRGRFGGVYFKKDRYGQHVQAAPRSIRKASMESPVIYASSPGGSRAAYINSWTNMAKAWGTIVAMEAMLMLLWKGFEDANDYLIGKKKPKKLNAYQWWMHYNVPRNAKGYPPYTKPPRSKGDLPPYTLTGEDLKVYASPTFMLYEMKEEYEDWPVYRRDMIYPYEKGEYFLWHYDDGWIISSCPGFPLPDNYWLKHGDDPAGTYLPSRPGLHDTTVWAKDC